MGIVLSVLVPSVSSRRNTFTPKIAEQLYGQQEALPPEDRQRVEILMLTCNKTMVLGHKRNMLVQIAQGDYVVFVDDDDRVEPDYLKSLLRAAETGADCITFNASVSINGQPPKLCRYSKAYKQDHNTADEYLRLPNHITAVKREIALRCPFPHMSCGEDSEYAKQLLPMLNSERNVARVLYHYDFNSNTTETQREPVVDVVFLSKASNERLQEMAQFAIDTCVAYCGSNSINVIVIEQNPAVTYRRATTIHETGAFNYNRFANMGASLGKAPWIMIANTDLDFQRGWLDALLAANHPIVSPVDPNNHAQVCLRRNESGRVNGRNLSGWCFMISRELWRKIGGFDEDFAFWCADDSLIEQVRNAGTLPMAVPDAKVKHLRSKTVGDALKAEDGALTWAMVEKFEKKYGVEKFVGDPRYANWKQRKQ